MCVAYGIQFSFGVFMPAIAAETGWDRAALSLPYSLYVFVYSALGVVTGRWTDSWGPRVVIVVGSCLLGIGTALMSQVSALWQFYVFFGLIAASGMSAAFVPCNATVVRWFIRQRGLALSIASSGSSFGNFLFPPLVAALIAAYGWRSTYVILGLVGVVLISLCAAFIVRDPGKLGLQPDGDEPRALPLSEAGDERSDDEWTLAAARHTATFWLLSAIFTLIWLVIFIPLVHIVPFAVDLGFSQGRAAFALSLIGLGGFAGRLVIGPISDRLGRTPALGLCLLLQTLSFLGFVFSAGLASLYPTAAMFGFSYGGTTMLFPALIGDFFGRVAVGAIMGFIFSLAGSSAAFGPIMAGYLHRLTGGYSAAFLLSAACTLAALTLVPFLKKPVRAIAP
ncbi:MAG: MFS transporter [Candidatus Binatia bacterium]